MFGVRFSSLFTSRWMALLWAVLICLMAIQFVGAGSDQDQQDAAQQTAPPGELTSADVATIKSAF